MTIWELEYIDVDLKNEENILSGKCKQGDTLTLNFNIYDDGTVADLSNVSMLLKANKSDKGYEIRDANITISGNAVKIKCPSSITQFAGDLKLELCFIDNTNNLQKSSFDINIKVKKSILGNVDGTVPTVIMTQLEQMDNSLNKIEGSITQAEATNTKLTNTNNSANYIDSTLKVSITSANTSKTNLDNSKASADILKSTLDSSISLAQQFISFVDTLSAGAPITTETGINITTETGEIWTL